MAALQDIAGMRVGLVTAPGGRDRLEPALRARGAHVLRADVYTREAQRADAARLRGPACRAWPRWAIALSSGEALRTLVDSAPADLASKLRGARVLAGSERLADGRARTRLPRHLRLAAGARPARPGGRAICPPGVMAVHDAASGSIPGTLRDTTRP